MFNVVVTSYETAITDCDVLAPIRLMLAIMYCCYSLLFTGVHYSVKQGWTKDFCLGGGGGKIIADGGKHLLPSLHL